MEETIKKLGEYAALDCSDLGEVCNVLIQLYDLRYRVSAKFKNALTDEIKTKLRIFEENATIVQEETVHVCKMLEWK